MILRVVITWNTILVIQRKRGTTHHNFGRFVSETTWRCYYQDLNKKYWIAARDGLMLLLSRNIIIDELKRSGLYPLALPCVGLLDLPYFSESLRALFTVDLTPHNHNDQYIHQTLWYRIHWDKYNIDSSDVGLSVRRLYLQHLNCEGTSLFRIMPTCKLKFCSYAISCSRSLMLRLWYKSTSLLLFLATDIPLILSYRK